MNRYAQPFFKKTYELLKVGEILKDRESGFYDISGIFSDLPEPMFIDSIHLGEAGNAYIAERMAKDVFPILAGKLAVKN